MADAYNTEKKPGFFGRLFAGLRKSRNSLQENLDEAFGCDTIDDEFYECLEEALVASDMGIETTETIIENLNQNETNMLNTVAESAELVRALDLPFVGLLADLFHMSIEQEDPQVLIDSCDLISHIHVSEAPGRVYPGKLAGEYFMQCVDKLHTAHFDRDVSVECTFGDMEPEAAAALKFLKETF